MKRPDFTSPGSLRYKMRRARFQYIEKLLDQILATKDTATILDMGGRRDYWKLLDPGYRDRVKITILNTEEDVNKEAIHEDIGIDIETVAGDATAMPEYADGSFDLAHSNSVIEHVGLLCNMVDFCSETARVGRAYYLQTPNFWFPLEPHYGVPFVHWLPDPCRLFLHNKINVGFAKKASFANAVIRVDHTRIISRRLLREALPDATHQSEKFLLMNKSLIAYRDYQAPA